MLLPWSRYGVCYRIYIEVCATNYQVHEMSNQTTPFSTAYRRFTAWQYLHRDSMQCLSSLIYLDSNLNVTQVLAILSWPIGPQSNYVKTIEPCLTVSFHHREVGPHRHKCSARSFWLCCSKTKALCLNPGTFSTALAWSDDSGVKKGIFRSKVHTSNYRLSTKALMAKGSHKYNSAKGHQSELLFI